MKILAIDTSSKRCSVSILEENEILINLFNDDEKTHSVKLMPMIDEALKTTNLNLDDINLISCCTGPGSFTGVRIGISTVKAFADVKNIPVVGISALKSLAYNIKEKAISNNSFVCSLIDAKNQNVYSGFYSFKENSCIQHIIFSDNIDATILKIISTLNNLNNNSECINPQNMPIKNIFFVGDGSIVYKEKILSAFENTYFTIEFAENTENIQNGISLAKSGLDEFSNGFFGDSSTIYPIYLKKSQAERALEEKIQIQEMTNEDIKQIEPIFNSQFDEFWNINNLKNDFSNESSHYFIAKLNDEIVGFAGILQICDEANIMNIATKINKRHLGIGSKLLQTLIEKTKTLNCTTITLEVNEHNTHAIKLYEKFNFDRIGLRKKYYNNTDNAILMKLSGF